jgi:dTDP-4-dehydrorhamnose 3,5-epimerase
VEIERLAIPDVLLIKPKVFGDARGFFIETWNRQKFATLGLAVEFVQDNHSHSSQGILRGLHYQMQNTQGKLVRVVNGAVFDVAVDIRRSSTTFGRWVGVELSATNNHQLWVPPGFAHGFLVLSEQADFVYKCTDYYAPAHERSILWNDPAIGIEWPIAAGGLPQLSSKDAAGILLRDAETFP